MKPRILLISFILVVLLFLFYFHFSMNKEPFTPGLKKLYRPYIRNTRVYMTNRYNNFIKKSHVFLAKVGIL